MKPFFLSFKSLLFILGVLLVSVRADEIKIEKDIPYLGKERKEKMDAYLPSSTFSRPSPVVIWIHGGGWRIGDKAAARELNICRTLAENGYAAFSINYFLGESETGKNVNADESSAISGPDEKAPWPQNFYDCKSAIRYVRQEAARFGIDPERIAIAGGSAGGHLSLLSGVTWNSEAMNKGGLYTEQSNRVSCIIDFYGIVEIKDEPRWIKRFTGSTEEETAANIKSASPRIYLGSGTPPVLIAHGTADKNVNIRQSEDLAKELEGMGIPVQLVVVPEGKHAFHFQPPEMDLRPAVLGFLEKYLGKPASFGKK